LWVDAFCEPAVERGAMPCRVQVETQTAKPPTPARATQRAAPVASASETKERLHARRTLDDKHGHAISSASARQGRDKNQSERVKILSRGPAEIGAPGTSAARLRSSRGFRVGTPGVTPTDAATAARRTPSSANDSRVRPSGSARRPGPVRTARCPTACLSAPAIPDATSTYGRDDQRGTRGRAPVLRRLVG
jgi:hypothetical protein